MQQQKFAAMKNFFSFAATCAAVFFLISSCNMLEGEQGSGSLSIHFAESIGVKGALSEIPDTNDFILRVLDSSGKYVYDGKFGDSPQKLSVPSGTYTVRTYSCEFDEPLYDCPQYGDEQIVVVNSGQDMLVNLLCTQMNCGVKLKVNPTFRTQFPSGVLYLKSNDGKLMYGYSEKRTAFFRPGSVLLELVNGSDAQILLSRRMEAQQMLSLSLNSTVSTASGSGIHVQVDTTHIWLDDSYSYGGAGEGESIENALGVGDARNSPGSKGVWVKGYIVGVCTSTTKSVYEPPFSINSNIVIAARSKVSERSECLSVELPKGDLRDAVNLQTNPSNLGKQIYLKGDLVDAYYGLPGLKSTCDFQWK